MILWSILLKLGLRCRCGGLAKYPGVYHKKELKGPIVNEIAASRNHRKQCFSTTTCYSWLSWSPVPCHPHERSVSCSEGDRVFQGVHEQIQLPNPWCLQSSILLHEPLLMSLRRSHPRWINRTVVSLSVR